MIVMVMRKISFQDIIIIRDVISAVVNDLGKNLCANIRKRDGGISLANVCNEDDKDCKNRIHPQCYS